MGTLRHLSTFILGLFTLLFFSACEKDEEEPPPGSEEGRQVGELAEYYLQEDPYKELRFTIIHMEGYAPKERAVDSLEDFLERYLRKPQGIKISTMEIDAEGGGSYSVEEIDEILDENAQYQPFEGAIHAYLLIVDGTYSEDDGNTNTLGLAYEADRTVLFGGNIEEYSDELTEPDRWKLEAAVMEHEFGHLLGLVDNGTPMVDDHLDEDHGQHCNDEDCLMYYATETSDVVSNLFESSIPDLDVECQKDLAANGGK